MKQFLFLAGLPRSGSTVLSAILQQNPAIYAGGNSPVCQMMWDVYSSTRHSCIEQITATRRQNAADRVIASVPHNYYDDIDRPVIVDKCRSWTMPANIDLIRRFITPEPRVIVLTRNIHDIVESFRKLYERNDKPFDPTELFLPETEPLARSLEGVQHAQANNSGEFLFVDYDDLINEPTRQLERIYEHAHLPTFNHDLDNIVDPNPEDDTVYGLAGMHQIRSTLGKV